MVYRRSGSSNSIQVQHEVTVVSDREAIRQREAPPVASDIRSYQQSSRGSSRRPNQPPGTAGKENAHGRHVSEGGPSRQSTREMAASQTNREGMRALADFLTRTAPPDSNQVSKENEDGPNLKKTKSRKTSPFKIFGKRSKKENGPESPPLPESVVSVSFPASFLLFI